MSRNRFYGLMPSVAFPFAESVAFRRNVGEYPRKDFTAIRILRKKDSDINKEERDRERNAL